MSIDPTEIQLNPIQQQALARAAEAMHRPWERKGLYTCWPVLTEVAHLAKTKASVRSLVASADGTFLNILPLVASDIAGIHSILGQYADQEFDLADACLMHLANRQSIETVFTLDVKDFSVYRNPNGQRLSILPAPPSPA